MGVNVKESIYLNTVKALHRMAFGDEVAVWRKGGCAVERNGGTISGKAAVDRGRAVRLFYFREGRIKYVHHFLNGIRPEFRPLLSEGGRGWGIGVKAKEI